jgi:multidrug efflux pump subunit AcrA (membrane-fusion protein)
VTHARQARILGALVLVWTAACQQQGEASPAKGGDAAATAAKGGGAVGAPNGAASRPPTILGANDVIEVKPGTIEDGITISGDLKPIEEIAVRSRVEGNIVGVYAREGDRVSRGQVLARFESSVQESDRTSAVADQEAAKPMSPMHSGTPTSRRSCSRRAPSRNGTCAPHNRHSSRPRLVWLPPTPACGP